MGCGCKKKQESTTQVAPNQQTVNITLVENSDGTITQSQENLVNQIVDKLNKIGENTENQ